MDAEQVRFKYYRYTDNNAGHWSVKENSIWGDNADSGLAAFNSADPIFYRTGRNFPRYTTLIDPQNGRTIKRTVGTLTAAAWTTANYTLDVKVIGLEDPVTFNLKARVNEKITIASTIYNAPQPAEVA